MAKLFIYGAVNTIICSVHEKAEAGAREPTGFVRTLVLIAQDQNVPVLSQVDA